MNLKLYVWTIGYDWAKGHTAEMGRKERAKEKWQRWFKEEVSSS